MMKTLMTAMKASISEVLEKMFYLPVEFKESLSSDNMELIKNDITKVCRLKVTGSFSAVFLLFIPDTLLLEMTQNFMGEAEENCTEEYLNGTLKEVLNMIIGNALKTLKTSKPPSLDIPEILNKDVKNIQPDSSIIAETTDGTMIMKIEL